MLSAEHYALESAAVQQLLRIREAEVKFFTDRFSSLTVQSALIGGFTIQTVTSINPSDHDDWWIGVVFWWSGALAFACTMHTVLSATFISIWGPSLALRGPKGSVTKAYYVMKKENTLVMRTYIGQLVFFTILMSMTFEIQDVHSNYHWPAMTAMAITLGSGLASFIIIRNIKQRLSHDKSTTSKLEELWDFGEDLKSDKNSKGVQMATRKIAYSKSPNELGESLLGNDMLVKESEGEVAKYSPRDRIVKNSPFSYEGELKKQGKRARKVFGDKDKWMATWMTRYYVLKSSTLYEFKSKDDFEAVLTANNGVLNKNGDENLKHFSLEGYEIMIDIRSEWPGLVFKPLDVDANLPTRYFRASESSVRTWAQHLVSATLISQQEGEKDYYLDL